MRKDYEYLHDDDLDGDFCKTCGGKTIEEFPRVPFQGRSGESILIGVINRASWRVCRDCAADEFLLRDSLAMEIVENLRLRFSRGEISNQEFRFIEEEELKGVLGISEIDQIPPGVHQEIVEFLKSINYEKLLFGVILQKNPAIHFQDSSTESENIQASWDQSSDSINVSMNVDVVKLVSMFENQIPRPLTGMWKRYRQLRTDRESVNRDFWSFNLGIDPRKLDLE